MANALNWIKARTKTITDDPIAVDGVIYDIKRDVFSGHLPRRMISAVAKAPLASTDTMTEVLVCHAKSGFTEYTRTTYTPRTAAA